MNIGIEARWITLNKTGFGNYAINLLRNLAKIDTINKYYIYANNKHSSNDIFTKPNFYKKVLKARPEIYKHIRLPIDILRKKNKINLFHFLYNAPSLITPIPFILTIHDVSYKHVPNMISLKNRLSILLQLALTAKKAKKIITVSNQSKKDIMDTFGIPESKISVIYEGIDPSFTSPKDFKLNEEILKKYNIKSKYILYVGTYLPHKNLKTLIAAYHKLVELKLIEHDLVIAGNKGRNYLEIYSMICKLGIQNRVHTIGYVEEHELPQIYKQSDLFIYPSLYEGFGLPLLEAMACNVPVLAANSSCLHEIGGEAAIYFDPINRNDLSQKIENCLKNNENRIDLIKKGAKRIKKFNWENTAVETHKIYMETIDALNRS